MKPGPLEAPFAPAVLHRLQRGLETLYRIEPQLDVRLFVVDDDERQRSLRGGQKRAGDGAGRRPREQLLVAGNGDEVSLGLYLDAAALANLERHDPRGGLHEHNFGDFLLAVEGVSHFVYVAACAAANRTVTALELELQAEIDKFVSCVLHDDQLAQAPHELRARLYENVHYANDLDDDERARYRAANFEARRYAGTLERRYLRGQAVPAMLAELRVFYRLSLEDKLGHIARTAA